MRLMDRLFTTPAMVTALSLLVICFSFLREYFVCDGFVSHLLLMAFTLIALAVFLLILEAARRRDFKQVACWFIPLIVFLICLPFVSLYHRALETRVRNEAAQIRDALRSHHDKGGQYPDSLTQLVPVFLSRVPQQRYMVTIPFNYCRALPGPIPRECVCPKPGCPVVWCRDEISEPEETFRLSYRTTRQHDTNCGPNGCEAAWCEF